MEITSKTLLADIASQIPAASDILRAHGIDPQVLADTPLGDAIEGTGLSIPGLVAEIRKASLHVAASADGPLNWRCRRPTRSWSTSWTPTTFQCGRPWMSSAARLSAVLLGEGDQPRNSTIPGASSSACGLWCGCIWRTRRLWFSPRSFPRRWKTGHGGVSGPPGDGPPCDHGGAAWASPGYAWATNRRPVPGPEWLALYCALRDLEHDMMRHIHLEDDRLIPAVWERQRRS